MCGICLFVMLLGWPLKQAYFPEHRLNLRDEDTLAEQLAQLANDELKVPFDDRLRADLLIAFDSSRPEIRAWALQCLESIYWKDRDFSEVILRRAARAPNSERLRLLATLRRAYPENGVGRPAAVEALWVQLLKTLETEEGWDESSSFMMMLENWLDGDAADVAWSFVIRLSESKHVAHRKAAVMSLIRVFWRKDNRGCATRAEGILTAMRAREEGSVREMLESNFMPLLELRQKENLR